MKLTYEHFSTIIETSPEKVAGMIIENQKIMYEFLMDLREAIEENTEKIILSKDNKIEDISKNVELLTDFIQFDMNQKALLSKMISAIDKISESEKFYQDSQQLLAQIEKHILDMTLEFPCELACEKLTMQSVIKGVGLSLVDDYSGLEERLLTYMELARDFLGKKLFVFVNVRGFIPYDKLQRMVDTALSREQEILFIDSVEYPKLKQEERLIIDEDMCEI